MAYIEWQDWMDVGIPLVDADHKLLVSLINHLHEGIGDAEEYSLLGSVLRSLEDYTDYHFQREERLQEEVGFPGLIEHKKLHAQLSSQVAEIRRRYDASRTSLRGVDVLVFLERWLIDHILNHDMGYRHFALGNAGAEAAAASIGMQHIRGALPPAQPFVWGQLRVLVVDDNANFLVLLETILRGVGIGLVRTATNAARGLELVEQEPFDVVISDWLMGGMDGVEFAATLRSSRDPLISNLPVLMVSGRGDGSLQGKALEAGVDDFIEKPISARDLLGKLARVITIRRAV